MKGIFKTAEIFAMGILALSIILQIGCKPAEQDEVPITTTSKEAREIFLEGRNVGEFGHTEKAADLFDQAIEKDPEFALAYLFKSFMAAETKDFQDALNQAVSLAPNVSEGEQKLIAASQALFGESDRMKANELYVELAEMFPKDKRMHWYLGRSYNGLRENDKAIASWEKALEIDKNFAPIYQDMGYLYRRQEDFAKAEESFQEYLRLSPDEPNAHDCLADLYRKMGKFEDAVEHYKKAVEMDSTFTTSQYKVGTTLFFMDKFEEGREELRKLMEARTEPAYKVYDMEGIMRSYIFEGDYANALEAADQCIQMGIELGLPEETAFCHTVKCAIYCELKDYDQAETSLSDCLDFLEKSDLVALLKNNLTAMATFWKAWVAMKRQDFESASAKAEEYKTQLDAIKNPNLMKYHSWLLACIALAQDDPAKAEEYFGQTEVDDPWFMYYHGLTKEEAGDTEGAKELFQKVADWNQDAIWYSFVRQKALAKI